MVPPDFSRNKIVVYSCNESVPINSKTPFLLTNINHYFALGYEKFQKPFKVVYLFQFGTGLSGHNQNYQLFPKD